MQKALSSIFWNFYAFCYDGVRELKPYREMLEEVLKELDLKPGMKVLDAGCGTGNLEELIAERYPDVEVVAVDFSPAMIKRARKKTRSTAIRFQELDLNQPLPFPDNYFDRVVCVNTFYNLKDHKKILSEFNRVLCSHGMIVLTTSKKGNSPGAILRAHRGIGEQEIGANNSGFLGWLSEIIFSFGTLRIFFRMILLALCNKVLLKTMREFEIDELSELVHRARFFVLQKYFVYAKQGILFMAMKSEFEEFGIVYKIAITEQEKENSFRLRYEGYCLDMKGIDEKYCPNKLEKDDYDDGAVHFIAVEDGRTIGTVRLVPVHQGKMPMEEFFAWPAYAARKDSLEVSRLYVVRDRRGNGRIMHHLLKLASIYSRCAQYRYWCFAALPNIIRITSEWGWQMDFFAEKRQIQVPTSAHFVAEFTPVIVPIRDETLPFPL